MDPYLKPEKIYKNIRRSDFEFVEKLLKYGQREQIKSEKDWQIFFEVLEFFFKRWPQEAEEFKKTVVEIKQTRANEKALSPSKEIKYLASLPPRFMKLIKKVFVFQEFNKKFMYTLIRKAPMFRIGE